MNSNSKELLRQAIQRITYDGERTIETSFMNIYSAIETLVLDYRKANGFETILDKTKWKVVSKGLMNFIKNQQDFSGAENKVKRRLVYEKLPELNRISFTTAFKEFSSFYNINLDDLWAFIDNTNGISLSEIRNKLLHGVIFNNEQLTALSMANTHLIWIAERIILSVLGWPIDESNVRRFRVPDNHKWTEYQNMLSNSLN